MRTTQYSDPVEAKLERLGLDVQYEPEAARFDAAEALYWFSNDNYAGQGDPLYSILSRLSYEPGPLSRGVDSESALLVYEALEDGSLDPQELFAWIEGARSNPAPKRKALRKRPCAMCGRPTYVTVDGAARCPDCTTSTVEDDSRHAYEANRRARKNPAKAKVVGKVLAVGDTSVMVVEDAQGFVVVTVRGAQVTPRKTYESRAEALAGATVVYETLKHMGRVNPADGGLVVYACPYCKDAARWVAHPGGYCEDCGGPAAGVVVWDGEDPESGHQVCAKCVRKWAQTPDPFKHEPCDEE